MSKRTHTSDEFGKPMSTGAGAGFDRFEADMGAPSRILLQGIDEEREGKTPSPFTIATWKIVLFLVIMFVLGLALAIYVIHSGPASFIGTDFNSP